MPVKLKIIKEGDPKGAHEQTFIKDVISIGRDIQNDLQLEGTKSVVSRRHAKIVKEGEVYRIIDLKSRNLTYLNDNKLKPETAYDLNNGDLIKICDFILQFSIEKETDKYLEKTILEFPNPFLQDSLNLSALLDQISKKYEAEEIGRKEEALQEAFEGTVGNVKLNEKAAEILINMLSPRKKTPTEALDKPMKKGTDLPIPTSGLIQRLMEVLLKFVVKLIQARRQFRLEFIGETMIRSTKSFSLLNCTYDELKNYLFAPDIPPSEQQKRIDHIQLVANEVMLHQVSLLDGYKASVKIGAKQLLDRVNPEVLKADLNKKKVNLAGLQIPYRYLPIINIYKLIKCYDEAHRELNQEDQSILEKKYFRPSYVRSYNKRMDSLRRPGTRTGSSIKK